MAKIKQDWAREKAERFVRIYNINASVFTDVEHEVKRLAALLRQTFEKGYQTGLHMGYLR